MELIEAIPRQFGVVYGPAARTYRVSGCALWARRGRGGVGGIGKTGAHVQPTRIPQHSSTETVVGGRMGGWESWRPEL